MVKFKHIDIKNYRSIVHTSLSYNSGVWNVIGTNNDADGMSSNGAGKSSILTALQQGLFNRSIFGSSIEDAYNKNNRRGYTIEIDFECNQGTFKVINDRELLKITIYELTNEGFVDIGVKSIPAALTIIQDLIGMDFNTFVATTYVSHSTVISMVENFTSSTLLKVILNFDKIYSIEKRTKELVKNSTETTRTLSTNLASISDTLTILSSFEPVDEVPIITEIDRLTLEKHSVLYSEDADTLSQLRNQLSELVIENASRVSKLSELTNTYALGTCPVCSSDIANNESIIETIESSKLGVLMYSDKISKLEERITQLSSSIDKSVESIDSKIEHYNTLLTNARFKNEQYDKYKTEIQQLRDRLKSDEITISQELALQDKYQAILGAIKSGAPLKLLIQSFCDTFNTFITEYSPLVSVNYVELTAVPKKNNIEFLVKDTRFNKQIVLTDLSGGEITRVRVVLLIALLRSIETLTNVATNILVFDESLDTLDESAAQDLANLFSYMVNKDDKFIALISHGAQLKDIEFTGNILVNKNDGDTTITQEV